MLSGLMRRRLALLSLPVLATVAVACGYGSQNIQLAKDDPDRRGAELFVQRCSGCHTLDVAGTEGSAVSANSREYKDGPNFDQRAEQYEQVLYAIRNGGFSSGPMPQNIVVGEDAEAVARFIAKYSGRERSAETGTAPE
jgi:mono/diheme cytochrome c family protein